jgi:microcystin degradation protein MlrC
VRTWIDRCIPQDNPGGGAPGDGTVILELLIAQRVSGVGYASIWDPQAIGLCKAAGAGGQLQLRFGGKTHHLGGQPIDAMVEVVALVDNATFSSNNGDLRSSLGPCALIRIDYPEGGSIHIVLSTSRNQVRSPIKLVLWITPSAER